MHLDKILKRIATGESVGLDVLTPISPEERDLADVLGYLSNNDYLRTKPGTRKYELTYKAKLLLSGGGFTEEAKKKRNAFFAFRISLIALIISLFGLLRLL